MFFLETTVRTLVTLGATALLSLHTASGYVTSNSTTSPSPSPIVQSTLSKNQRLLQASIEVIKRTCAMIGADQHDLEAEKRAYEAAYTMYNVTAKDISTYQNELYFDRSFASDRAKIDAAQEKYCGNGKT